MNINLNYHNKINNNLKNKNKYKMIIKLLIIKYKMLLNKI